MTFDKTTPGLALIDYDNLRGFRRKSLADFELHATDLIDTLTRAFRSGFPGIRELDVRFYGGWTDEFGLPSRDHLWFLQTLPRLRGRRHGLIVRPALATAMLQFPEVILRGTVRVEASQPSHKRRLRQKMVDGMLGCDAMFAAAAGFARIGVITGDDDLVPATLTAHTANPGLTVWMRPRRAGAGPNERGLIERGLRIRPI
ncbi:MAG: hypothetical protein F4X11_07760 [Acidobacteria bacterium]|nr:hypothetical protein [Acidobacteriota bacterium]